MNFGLSLQHAELELAIVHALSFLVHREYERCNKLFRFCGWHEFYAEKYENPILVYLDRLRKRHGKNTFFVDWLSRWQIILRLMFLLPD